MISGLKQPKKNPIFCSEINELDFEQPRILYNKVFDQGARDRFIKNVAGHLGQVKQAEVKARQCTFLIEFTPQFELTFVSFQSSIRI